MAQVVGSRRKRWLETVLVYAVLVLGAGLCVSADLGARAVAEDAIADLRHASALSVVADTRELCRRLDRADFAQAFINTLIVSRARCCCRSASGFRRLTRSRVFRSPAGRSCSFALLVMRMLPPIAVLVPMYVLFSKLGLATTRFSVVLADTTFALPLVVWLMRGFFEDLPPSWRKAPGSTAPAAIVRSGTSFCRWRGQAWSPRAFYACNWRGMIFCSRRC